MSRGLNQETLSSVTSTMRFLLLALLLTSSAFAANRECGKNCDELLKSMAAECRKAEKGGGGPKHPGEDSHNDAEACNANLKKMRLACTKNCQAESSKKR